MSVYYNEIDPQAAAWLRELIAAGELPKGVVDERDIRDIVPSELAEFEQCHFFAGIGGWVYALKLAAWTGPCWTGSCPCQPFSAAGKGAGFADERHLWPAWFHLIRECRPRVVFGEQVDKATGWLDLVHTDLEAEGYAFGAVDLPAGSVGAPHRRQRLWFVAESECRTAERHGLQVGAATRGVQGEAQQREWFRDDPRDGVSVVALANDDDDRRQEQRGAGLRRAAVYDADGCGEAGGPVEQPEGELALSSAGREERPISGGRGSRSSAQGVDERSGRGGALSFWSPCDWLPCRDGKFRPVEPGTFPLAHGVSARVGRLRGYGNAVVAPLAAEFVKAYMEIA